MLSEDSTEAFITLAHLFKSKKSIKFIDLFWPDKVLPRRRPSTPLFHGAIFFLGLQRLIAHFYETEICWKRARY